MTGSSPEAPRDLLDELESVCDLLESPTAPSPARPVPPPRPQAPLPPQPDLFAAPAADAAPVAVPKAGELDALIDTLVAEYLPRLEQELRRRLAERLKSGSGQ